MPKDWDQHKAEIERLYMVERRPLKEVRNVMKNQFSFNASVRAYRMKLDQWRLWKNNSKTERRKTKAISRLRQPRAIEASDTEDHDPSSMVAAPSPSQVDVSATEEFMEIYGVLLPSRSLDIADLLPLISTTTPTRGLEIMLMKWKSDGSYLKAALRYLRDNKWDFHIFLDTLDRRNIFQVIDEVLDGNEKFLLAKKCLSIDFEQSQCPQSLYRSTSFSRWMFPWRNAFNCDTWEEVKNYLYMISQDLDWGGPLFTSVAFPFLGETLLYRKLKAMEHSRAQGGPLGTSGADHAKRCLLECVEILISFEGNPALDVDISCYQRILRLGQWIQEQNQIHEWQQLKQLGQYQEKLLQLKSLHKEHESADSAGGTVENLLKAANLLKESKAILDTVQGEDESGDSQHYSMSPRSPEIPIAGLQPPPRSSSPVPPNQDHARTFLATLLKPTTGLQPSPESSVPVQPTQDDARRSLDTLLNFFNQARPSLVNQNEYMAILKLTEKLRIYQNNTSLSGTLRRVAKQSYEPPAPPSTSTIAQPDSSPSTDGAVQALLEDVHKRWSWEEDIVDDVYDLLELIETHCTSGPLCVSENIFIIISKTIPPKEQISFTAAILAAIDESFSIFHPLKEIDWHTWLDDHMPSSLQSLQKTFDLPLPLKSYLDDRIGSDVVKLILNACVTLAAERALSNLKAEILNEYKQAPSKTYLSSDFCLFRRLYIEMLDKLQVQNLKVDQKWYIFLGRLLSWAIGTEMFQSSEEESD